MTLAPDGISNPMILGASIDAALGLTEQHLQQARALDYYNGKCKRALQPRPGEVDDNVSTGLAALIVDCGVSYLFGADVQSQVQGTNPQAPQDWLDEAHRRCCPSGWGLLLQHIATNGAIAGTAYARLLDTKPWPRITCVDPLTVQVKTAPDDYECPISYTIEPPPDDSDPDRPPERTRTLITNESAASRTRYDVPENWSITEQTFAGGTWVTTQSTRWPYPFSPMVHCDNLPRPNEFLGTSDLPPAVLHLLDVLHRLLSHYAKISRLMAHPIVFSTGLGARQLDRSIDSVMHLPSESAKLQALELPCDLPGIMAMIDKCMHLLAQMVRIPLVALGEPDQGGALSGVALDIRWRPLVQKSEVKRRTYGNLVTALDERLLVMGGWGPSQRVELQWPEMLPRDPLIERQVAVLDESLGVSKQTILDSLGYQADEETALKAKEQPDVPAPAPLKAPAPMQPYGARPPLEK